MLHLAEPTDPGWFDRIRGHLDTILIDHCHLEKRAASNALNLIFRYTGRAGLPRALSEVVREEMEHFTQVLDILDARGVAFVKLTPSPYALALQTHLTKQEPEAFLDKLLMAAFIEARSCERFKVLSEGLAEEEPGLAAFYRDLMISEARHHLLYTNFAREFFGEALVKVRLKELGAAEAQALRDAGFAPRLHSF